METHGLAELRSIRPASLPSPEVRRALRMAAGISQRNLGHVLGVSGVAVHRYERGLREPQGQVRSRYAKVLEELRRV